MSRQGTRVATSPGNRSLLRITWPFLAIVVLLVLLASESLKIVSASRAYVGGERLRAKAQKEALYSLLRYEQSHSASDFRDHLESTLARREERAADRAPYERDKYPG